MAAKHINARPGDFAETVLMPGDPLRAQHIAENYLADARRVNDVRNMWGYTGDIAASRCSVMASGMGIPSASIYCHELFAEYGVKRLIRVGSCGTVHPAVKLRDIVIAMGASTDSGVNRMRFRGYDSRRSRASSWCATRCRSRSRRSSGFTSATSSPPISSTRPSPRCST